MKRTAPARATSVAPILGALAVAITLGAAPAVIAAQETAPPSEKQDAKLDPKEGQPTTDAPLSLDELLGIESAEDDGKEAGDAERVADMEADAELERRLAEEEIGNAFAVAIQKMAIVAELLDTKFDTGLGTQRVQEEVLSKLDLLLEAAKKNQCSGGSSGSSSSASRSAQPKPKPGKQGGKGAKQGPRSDDPASDGQNTDAPNPRDGDLNAVFEEARTEWGSLPQRVRDMLLQGRKEKFSSLYEQLTREYYRRLAEEGSP